MDYNFREIEAKWQKEWKEKGVYRVDVDESRPKFYVHRPRRRKGYFYYVVSPRSRFAP